MKRADVMQCDRSRVTQVQRGQVRWGKLIAKLAIWTVTELLLGWVGLDNLADYGEFVLGDVGPALYQIQPQRQGGLDLVF